MNNTPEPFSGRFLTCSRVLRFRK